MGLQLDRPSREYVLSLISDATKIVKAIQDDGLITEERWSELIDSSLGFLEDHLSEDPQSKELLEVCFTVATPEELPAYIEGKELRKLREALGKLYTRVNSRRRIPGVENGQAVEYTKAYAKAQGAAKKELIRRYAGEFYFTPGDHFSRFRKLRQNHYAEYRSIFHEAKRIAFAEAEGEVYKRGPNVRSFT